MSDILGKGYGSAHTWKRIRTAQVGSAPPQARYTIYKCTTCSVVFQHYYAIISDIFMAMEDMDVPAKCVNH